MSRRNLSMGPNTPADQEVLDTGPARAVPALCVKGFHYTCTFINERCSLADSGGAFSAPYV